MVQILVVGPELAEDLYIRFIHFTNKDLMLSQRENSAINPNSAFASSTFPISTPGTPVRRSPIIAFCGTFNSSQTNPMISLTELPFPVLIFSDRGREDLFSATMRWALAMSHTST